MPRPRAILSFLVVVVACTASAGRRGPNDARGGPPRWRTLGARFVVDAGVSAEVDGGVADGGVRADAGARVDASVALRDRCPPDAVFVQGGSFLMGSADGEGAADEHPRRRVTLSGFCLDRTEVTAASYTRCVAAHACTRSASVIPNDALPVTGVDWLQATTYCLYMGGRLPTEAEWEFAARGPSGRVYPWGDEAPADCARLDWTRRNEACGGVGPSPVGAHPTGASPFGALDMAGNVWEWTADWYARTYPEGAQEDPQGPEQGSARVTRGGGWNNDQPDRFRTTWREGQHPSFQDYDLGFRCAFDTER